MNRVFHAVGRFARHLRRDERLRWRWVLGIVWVGAAALAFPAAVARFSLPATPLADPDTWANLGPAVHFLSGDGFLQVYRQSFLYPAFLLAVLQVSGGLELAATLQHAAGLAAGLLLTASWLRLARLFPSSVARDLAVVVVGPACLWLFWSGAPTILFEHTLRGESFAALALFAQTFLTLDAMVRVREKRDPSVAGVELALAVVAACASYMLRPAFGLSVLMAGPPLIVFLMHGGPSRCQRVLPLWLAPLLVLIFLVLPGRLTYRESLRSETFLPLTLMSMHPDVLVSSMEREMRSGRVADAGKTRAFHDFLVVEWRKAREDPRRCPSLGHNPDYLLYDAPFGPVLAERGGMTEEDIAALTWKYYALGWRHDPLHMLSKIWTQLRLLPTNNRLWKSQAVTPLGPEYALGHYSLQLLDGGLLMKLRAGRDYLAGLDRAARGEPVIRTPREVRRWLDRAGAAAVPALIMGGLAALAALVAARPPGLRAGAAAALWLVGIVGGSALTVALVHTFDTTRYAWALTPAALFALGALLLFLAAWGREVVRGTARRLRGRGGAGPAGS